MNALDDLPVDADAADVDGTSMVVPHVCGSRTCLKSIKKLSDVTGARVHPRKIKPTIPAGRD